jgi:hypothetical protein
MHPFVQRHRSDVIGVLSGWDRLRRRGTLRWLANCRGMMNYLWTTQVRLKDFREYATGITDRIRRAGEHIAAAAGRPVIYLVSSSERKERRAQEIAARDAITAGLICVLTCVEPCWSYKVRRNPERQRLELCGGHYKCLHHYFYLQHPLWGFMHVRLQTWFPFTVHVCLNGREWLARQLDGAGIRYVRRDNCFAAVADLARAQTLLNAQLRVHWPQHLNALLRELHPTHAEIFQRSPTHYYWSAEESEWATDVLFRSPQRLAHLYPRFVQHSLQSFASAEVMRFLGRKTPAHGGVNGHFQGEVVSDLKTRPEGIRVKHRVNRNSLKMYDKQGSVLRVETTVNDVSDLQAYRRTEAQPRGPRRWRRMRKGVADLHRRAQVCQAANERYLSALAAVDQTTPLGTLTAALCRPVRWRGQRVRALNPLASGDAQLLAAVNRGEFALNGFRNRDLRALLYPTTTTSRRARRRTTAKVTRHLRLLRAHRLIFKVAKTHRYLLTPKGRIIITALLTARHADTTKLTALAA